MRRSYHYPLAAIVSMVLVSGMIGIILLRTGALFEFGRSLALTLVAAIVAAGLVTGVVFALRRAGVHRISDLRTWPKN